MARQLRRHTNAPSTFLLFLGLSSSIPATIAHPLAPRGTRPSATTSYKIAIGFTIAISLIIFSAAVFYLGRRRERTQTWFCWRDPVQSSEKNGQRSDSSFDYPEPNRLKTRISFPKMIGSSAPVELSSPVDRKPKYLELQGEIPVYEMGEPSPKQRRSGTFFQSMEQGIYANSQNPEKSARDDVGPPVPAKNEKYSPDVVPQTLNSPPAYPRATYMGRGRSTRRSSVMDWSGLEYVKRIYASKSLRRTS